MTPEASVEPAVTSIIDESLGSVTEAAIRIAALVATREREARRLDQEFLLELDREVSLLHDLVHSQKAATADYDACIWRLHDSIRARAQEEPQ